MKTNTDGSSRGNPGRSGCGNVFRDNFRDIRGVQLEGLGISSSYMAECYGILHAAETAYNKRDGSDCKLSQTLKLLLQASTIMGSLGNWMESGSFTIIKCISLINTHGRNYTSVLMIVHIKQAILKVYRRVARSEGDHTYLVRTTELSILFRFTCKLDNKVVTVGNVHDPGNLAISLDL
ncbi:hypothetical protein GIB67_034770 [Kingdonia uniflora]|uniref:RNase H type-1 domain-containing protein n=1 Tax=Kingdonia uniflora TaxID=39325 RepID=A0A7J7ME75_9MAGN|nr:hypothetical protein GIB67_034770 [Kingdonia uniflora]